VIRGSLDGDGAADMSFDVFGQPDLNAAISFSSRSPFPPQATRRARNRTFD
jgi:hypothetical protein